MKKKNILTYEGYLKLEEELEDLKVNKRKAVAQKIKEAREQGDITENADYDAAIEWQRQIEGRITEIMTLLQNVDIVVEEEIDMDTVNIGCHVTVLDCELKEKLEYKIVGSTEASSLEGRLSNESPLGAALIGAKKGDTVKVNCPDGILKYKVLELNK